MSQPEKFGLLTNEHLKMALQHWHDNGQGENPFATLYLFRKTQRETQQTTRHVINQLLLQALEILKLVDDKAACLLQLRFLDRRSINYLAKHFNISESAVYVNQRNALTALTTILIDLDTAARATQEDILYQRLEAPTYVELIGVDSHIDQLLHQLCAPNAPWLIALEGLGGIGKTSLAHQLIQQIIAQGTYDEVGWVSAQRKRLTLGGTIATTDKATLTAEQLIELLVYQLMPEVALAQRDNPAALLRALRRRLKQFPHLLVVDNLETLVDLETLLPTLQDLANPSKFLLTSREALYATPNIYHFRVPELSETAALALIRQEIAVSNLTRLAGWADAELRPIFATVGGNPLALRLVIGQAHIHELDVILAQLRQASGRTAENLYNYIYRHAWESLAEVEQDVLLVMPLVNPAGDSIERIAAYGGFEVDTVRQTLNRLVTLSLVDVRGSSQQHLYTIHSLTRTFLHDDIL